MTLADLIQSQVNKDIEKLENQHNANLQDLKSIWDSNVAEVKKVHSEKIEEAVSTQINFQKFQKSKTVKFNDGYTIQEQLDNIYLDLISDILKSKFVHNLIVSILKDIPNSTTLTLSGKHSQELEQIIQNLKFSIKHHKDDSTLGKINAKLESGHLEITVEDILDKVKKLTLPLVIKEI